jgi:hypothetical protein
LDMRTLQWIIAARRDELRQHRLFDLLEAGR